jgi:hypothetical protein
MDKKENLMQMDISLLLKKEESPTVEFKRQWYWDDCNRLVKDV